MKKNYFLKVMMALMLTMLMTVGNVFADKAWVKVTQNSNLSVGDTIIIAAVTFDKAMSTQNSNNRAATDIVKNTDGSMITSIGSAQFFIVQAGNAAETFAFYDPVENGYLYAAGAESGNFLRTETALDTNGRGNWVISYTDDGAIDEIVAQTELTNRNKMRYNSSTNNGNLFSCYSLGQQPVTIYRYETVQDAAVATPVITPDAGVFITPQTVNISCATAGATILYTIDGSDPATNGTVYTDELTVSTTTIVKAIAFLGADTSFMAQTTYTFPIEVADIAAFKAANTSTNSTPYSITGDVTYVFRGGRYMYVKDASAALMIYDDYSPVITNEYTEGDVISGGLLGTYTKYNNQVELIPIFNPAASTQNTGTVQPIVVTMADLLANYDTYDAQLITLENVTFANGFTGSSNTTITQGENTMTLYKRFTLDTTLAAGTVTNVTGFASIYNNTIQICPRYNEDLSAAPQPAQPSMTVTLNGEEFSTLDTLQVNFDIQNFTLGTDGLLKLESQLFEAVGMQSPMYLNDQMLAIFLAQTFSPLPAGIHTVTASLVDMTMAELTPAVSQTLTFTVTAPAAEAPVFTPVAGTYADSVVVSLTCATTNATIRYTLDGSDPVETSTEYTTAFTLNATTTVKAKAFMNSVSWEDSPIATAIYTLVSEPTLTVSPDTLNFSSTQLTGTINISSASLTAPITISCDNTHFTLSETSLEANVGNASITVTYDAVEPAAANVTVSSGDLTAQVALVATAQLPVPVITPADGTSDTLITVEMSHTVADAAIYYTTDGTDPDANATLYTSAIALNTLGTYTFKAIAVKEAWENSEMVTATYTVVAPVVPSIDTIMYTVGFEAEEGFEASTTYNNQQVNYTGADGQQWGTYYGTPSVNDKICGAQSMQMRWYSSAPDNLGYTYTNFDVRNVTYVTFNAKQNSGLKLKVSYSVDGGSTFVGDSVYTLGTSNTNNYRYNVSETGEYNFVRLKFAVVLPETTPSASQNKLIIDSVVVFGVPGIIAEVVEAPVITPSSGTFYETFDATITCATDNAIIRYTTDGSEPTETSAVYSSAISISSTTTLKAKAWKEGMTPSFVTTATYNFPVEVANIAAFKAASTATNSTVYKITGDVTFVYRSGKYMFVQDESAALLLFDNNTNNPVISTIYDEGDVISDGVFGTYTLYSGMVEMVPTYNTAEASGNTGTVNPTVAAIPTLVSQYSTYESQLVIIEDVTFIGDYKFVNGTDTMAYYDRFNTIENDPVAGDMGSITGFLAVYNGKVQLYPRDENDITIGSAEHVATPTFTPAAGTYENSVEVSINCATADATIYYTLDGTEPTTAATVYSAPFTLTTTTSVKAIAVKEGMTDSEVAEANYVINIVGINDVQQFISIYPNPTSSDITLDLSGLNAKTVELFSMNGQLLYSVVPTETSMTLSLSEYAAGVYFIRIHSDKAVSTQKIVKK